MAGERHQWSRTEAPPSAKTYYLRHLKHDCPRHAVRNLREMKTSCTVLDHIAMGRAGAAGDVITQRLKAVELATKEESWSRSGFLELVEEDTATLVSTDEHMLVRKEVEARDKRYAPSSSGKGSGKDGKDKQPPHHAPSPHQWIPKGWGQSKGGQKGGKHPKGNDKGKNNAPATK